MNRNKNLGALRAFAGLFTLLAFAPVTVPGATNNHAKTSKLANTVVLDATAVQNLRVATVAAQEQRFEETIFALGRIDVRPGYSAVLSSRIPGRAIEVKALPDHEVTQGEPLVIVESRQAGDPPPRVTLNAPISGVISEVTIEPGEPVSADEALLRIVNVKSLYGIARIPESLASKLRTGLAATVRVPGWPGEEWRTQIEHLGVVADAASGTLEAAFHIENAGFKLRPGMRAEFSIVIGVRENVMSIPRTALQGDPAQRFVFVADETIPHAFIKAPVVVGAMNERFVEIRRGLFPGDKVVTEGAYWLAFAGTGTVSLKEALDAAHGHEHNPDGSELRPGQTASSSGSTSPPHSRGISALTLFSLAGNAVLLVLLGVFGISARRRTSDSTSNKAPS